MENQSKITYGLTDIERSPKPQTTFFHESSEYFLLDKDLETNVDVSISAIDSLLLDENNWDSTASIEEKNRIFRDSQNLIINFKTAMNQVHYNLFLKRREINWFDEFITRHCNYENGDEVFEGLFIKRNLIEGEWSENPKPKNDTDIYLVKLRGVYIPLIYKYLSRFKVKGLPKDAETFFGFFSKLEMIANVNNFYAQKAQAIETRSIELNNYNTTDDEFKTLQSAIASAETTSTETTTVKTVKKGKSTQS